MVIDLDDDEPEPTKLTQPSAAFEDEEEEIDPLEPYLNILRTINISLGTGARHLTVPQIPLRISQASFGAYPPIYSTHIVVAVACEDSSVRLVSLPLTPPPQEVEDPFALGVQIVKIGPTSHQDPVSSITVTHTSPTVDSDDEVDKGKSRSRSRSRLGNTAAASTDSRIAQQWSFLIATVSSTAGGLLLVHQLPSASDAALSTVPESDVLLQRQYFSSQVIGSTINFNPSPYPAERHSNILVTFPDSGCVKIYQALPDVNLAYSRGRRGSAATTESANSSSRSLPVLATRSGKLLLTLYAGFIESSESVPSARRKRVLDASWVLGGRAILTLLEDGEWGVWDVEGAGPTSSNQSLFRGQNNVCGIQGGALTRFSFKGFVTPPADNIPKTRQAEEQSMKSGKLAPMTPHTRQVRSDGLFRGSTSRNPTTASSGRFSQGCISVNQPQSANLSSAATPTGESVLLSIGNNNLSIPSLLSLWRAESTGKGSLDSSGLLRPHPFMALQLGGEQQKSIAALPESSNTTPSTLLGSTGGKMTDVLISTENRLIMLVAPISQPQASSGPTYEGAGATSGRTDADLLLLTQGDLDIDGMDRILDSMTSRNDKATARPGKSVDFDLDDNGDIVGMGTPTPKNHRRIARAGATPGATRSGKTRREIFT